VATVFDIGPSISTATRACWRTRARSSRCAGAPGRCSRPARPPAGVREQVVDHGNGLARTVCRRGQPLVQISAIRRAFGHAPGGEAWIETLPRRGYRFVGPVSARPRAAPASPVAAADTTAAAESWRSPVGCKQQRLEGAALALGRAEPGRAAGVPSRARGATGPRRDTAPASHECRRGLVGRSRVPLTLPRLRAQRSRGRPRPGLPSAAVAGARRWRSSRRRSCRCPRCTRAARQTSRSRRSP